MKKFIFFKEAKCPNCNNLLHGVEDETVWYCDSEDCPVSYIIIMDKHGNPITQEDEAIYDYYKNISHL